VLQWATIMIVAFTPTVVHAHVLKVKIASIDFISIHGEVNETITIFVMSMIDARRFFMAGYTGGPAAARYCGYSVLVTIQYPRGCHRSRCSAEYRPLQAP
jgi:hypothetical protein